MEGLLKLWPLLLFLINGLMGWAVWSMRKEFATKADVAEVKESVGNLAGRVELVERDLEHLPSKDDLNKLQLELAKVVGELREVRSDYRHLMENQGRIDQVLTRHEQIFSDAARQR
ncbi:Protein of unknown function [Tistlia consotensis]|uniref:DUF2730 family protein n=1 Tax=Tistlia consotensis USBA 355 TaxID=560819 RepID=A0A1Y6CRF8_9PROT|nr:DUF2730 family protein [Tistlia consotensis]SMF85798.1 Protein of unknown function [Tistlia consotensis USBA 355]SNS37850.1 Protein of unknown function [Tistlia consotensis]